MMAIRKTARTRRRYRSGIPWNREETTVLRELYADHSDRELALRLGRSEWAVRGKARSLGLVHQENPTHRAPRNSRPWSDTEVRLLTELYETTPYEEIADLIGRTRNAVHLKAEKLGLRKMDFWSEEGDRLLAEYHKSLPYDKVAELLGRTVAAVKIRTITRALGAKKPRWTEEEIRSLMQDYDHTASDTMSATLGRTRRALLERARREGLPRKPRWSKAEIEALTALLPDHTTREISRLIGRSHDAVRYKIQQLRSGQTAGTAEHGIAPQELLEVKAR